MAGAADRQEYALRVIRETNAAWKRLISGQAAAKDIEIKNITVAGSPGKVDPFKESAEIPQAQHLPPAPVDPSVDKWHFVSIL